ncbi:MAG: MmgE/PrpD family protein [Chloroflexi bacterium]|nr:MmgE/PrpD family protein [Chloroflexota bacterium]
MKDNSRTYAEQLGDFVAGLDYASLPADVAQKTKQLILDSLGIGLAGSNTEWARITLRVAQALGGPAESRAIGGGEMLSAPNAALVNATMIHGLDYDDTYMPGMLHVSCFVISTLLAMSEARGASGRDALVAAAAAYETSCRLSRAALDQSTGRNRFVTRGFHGAGIFSPLGAAAAASKIMKMDADMIASSLGIAASQSSGLMQTQLEGTWLKTVHPGWGAHSGILSCYLAQAGLTAPHRVFEGEFGFFNAFLGQGNFSLEELTRRLGREWNMREISFKLYPAGHGTHFFLESALHLQERHQFRTEDIAEVRCLVSPFRVNAHFEPREVKYTPTNEYIARFSLPYLLAVRLLRDDVGLDAFSDESLKDPAILALADKVTYVVDEKGDLIENRGHIMVRTRDGNTYEGRETVIPGTPERPATQAEIERKFRVNVKHMLSPERIEAVIDQVSNLESLDNMKRLVDLVVGG